MADLQATLRGPGAYKLAAKTLALMEQHKVWPTAVNYELWLNYAADPKGRIGLALGKLLNDGQTITESVADALAASYLPRLRVTEQVCDAGDQLSRELGTVTGAIENAKAFSDAYGEVLARAGENLSSESDAKVVKGIVDQLSDATRKAKRQNSMLGDHLRDSTLEVSRLKEHLEIVRRDSMTDALTMLANRKSFDEQLEAAIAEAGRGRGFTLALLDIDHFKAYNDTYGHPAGDSLLIRLGSALREAVGTSGTAYRMGGDEFCLLTHPSQDELDGLLAKAAAALSERGEGFTITCSYGSVLLPAEAGNAERALQIADERMYVQKNSSRVSAGRQSSDVLLRALSERHPSLGEHVKGVAELALAIGERLNLPPEEIEDLRRPAELHDIGKVAVPDAILAKPDALNDAEWEYARHHTIIAERILQAAPALGSVAKIVRSTHERMD